MIKHIHTLLSVLIVLITINQAANAQEVSFHDTNLESAIRNTLEDIEDVAGTYFHDELSADQPLTQGTAWQRAAMAHIGFAVEAWGESGYQAGTGYQPTAPKDATHGTPGYHNDVLASESQRGQISISEVMFTNTIRNRTAPQWIELYNRLHSEAVNLTYPGRLHCQTQHRLLLSDRGCIIHRRTSAISNRPFKRNCICNR